MKLSLIIPIYNEERKIRACLKNLSSLPAETEILFSDGGSTDKTLAIIGDRYPVIHAPKGRAAQMNAAAGEASGDILWFSHCDSLLPAEGPSMILQAVEEGAVFGCFRIAFDYRGPFMKCNTFNSNFRAKHLHIAFGDQGIFMTKALFAKCGGFPDLPLMEDYELSKRMKRANVPLTVLPATIVTSGRRYRTRHPLLTMWQMFRLRRMYDAGVDINRIAQMYKDIR